MKISASIICKNEESCIEKMLESIKDCDEIIIVDTGSTDNTIEIAKKYTDKIYTDYTWNDDFAEARNYSLSKCTGDWILIIDCDEVLKNTIEEVKKVIENTKSNSLHFNIVNGKFLMKNIRAFKRGDIEWRGSAHNYLINVNPDVSELTIEYGYSKAHELDPDRTLRILLKNHPTAREKFYLAREYLYRKDYENALLWYEKYIRESRFKYEICEAYLQMARCKWAMGKGQEARNYCLKAIEGNPNFKEALRFMGEISWEKEGNVWKRFAEIATNENVLFIR